MNKLLSRIAAALLMLFATAVGLYGLGLRINTSNSIPKGVYWVSSSPLSKGAYVLFCPDSRPVFQQARQFGILSYGLCPYRFGYLMKQVAALAGDVVASNEQGVWVNGHRLPFSQPKSVHLPLWQSAPYCLQTHEVLLLTDQNSWSFDARYFGLLDRGQIKAVIKPLFTWPFYTSNEGKQNEP